MLSLTRKTLIEVLRRVLGRDPADLEEQILAAGANPGDRPPLEERADTDPVELRHPAVADLSGDLLRVRGGVVVRRERDLAHAPEVDGKFAGGMVDAVAEDGSGRQKADREAVVGELGVCRRRRLARVRVLRRTSDYKLQEREEEQERLEFNHCFYFLFFLLNYFSILRY